MDLEIISIDPSREKVVLKANVDLWLSDFAIIDNSYDNDRSVSNIHRHFYKFPLVRALKGTEIWVFTEKGGDSYSSHIFYMNNPHPIWNDGGDKISVFKMTDIDTKPVKPNK